MALLAVLAMPLWGEESHPPAATDNQEAVRDFGRDPGPRIRNGVLFIDAAYMPPPYSVERRGLEVLINGHLVFAGIEWPPFDPAVSVDPGDAPTGSSPFDDRPGDYRQGYWDRKARYLIQRHEPGLARALMMDEMRRMGFFKEVRADTESGSSQDITVIDATGQEKGIEFWGGSCEKQVTDPAQALRASVERQLNLATLLNDGGVVGLTGAARVGYLGLPEQWSIPPSTAEAFLDIMASPLRPIPRLDALIARHFTHAGDSTNHEILQAIVVDEALRRRMEDDGITPQGDDMAAYREFGAMAADAIATGFLIYGNRYIPPPYVISRQGLAISVNDLQVVAPPVGAGPSHDEALRAATATMDRLTGVMHAGGLVGVLGDGSEWSVDRAVQARFFSIMLSPATGADKVQQVIAERLLASPSGTLTEALVHFEQGGDGLYRRLGMTPPFNMSAPGVGLQMTDLAARGQGPTSTCVLESATSLLRPGVWVAIATMAMIAIATVVWLVTAKQTVDRPYKRM